MEHKLPWKLDVVNNQLCIKDAEGQPVIIISDRDIAKFIVKCVNAHDELVEACKEAIRSIERIQDRMNDTWLGSEAIKQLEQALAKAEEE